jgi:hypothetical protein
MAVHGVMGPGVELIDIRGKWRAGALNKRCPVPRPLILPLAVPHLFSFVPFIPFFPSSRKCAREQQRRLLAFFSPSPASSFLLAGIM